MDLGITAAVPAPLQKRVRLTNGLSLFGAVIMLASVPFDQAQAPPWMVVEDVLGGLGFALFPLLNRGGHFTGARLFCIAVANLIVLGNVALLGRDSGAELVFVSLVAVPFALFELSERGPLSLAVAMPIVGFAVGHSGALVPLRHVSDNYSAPAYFLYSAAVALAVLLFSVLQTSLANARAERALRDDIAERLRAEKALELTRQASITSAKLAALGEMSGNIAHEINNPLAAILIRVQRLQRLATRDRLDLAAVNEASQSIETTVNRIRQIVDALRFFARDAANDPMRPEPVRQIVADTVELCAQRFRQHAVELDIAPIADDVFVRCRGVQISQILLNLLSNAHDAVVDQPTRRVRVTVEALPEDVLLAVLDSGPGIPVELRGRVMEPFFTTKDIGKGTGLGLSVSKGIAEGHGGSLTYDVASAETRFVLRLVRAPAPSP